MSFFGPRPPGSSASSLISFYEGTGRDHRGRRLSEILRWDAARLESSHDYIQTMFPLPEASGVNWDAPVINRQVFDAFRSRMELRGHLRDSFQKILWFYGFKLVYEEGEAKVSKGANYGEHSGNWNNRFDHNHLRITRIIRSLRVLGLEDEAKAFRIAITSSATRVDPRSREFWRRAAERALNLRPDLNIDDENDTKIGPKFLREFEAERQARLAAAAHNTQAQAQGQAVARASNEHGEEEKQGLFEDEEVSDQPDQFGLETPSGSQEQKGLFQEGEDDKVDNAVSEAPNENAEEPEWKGFSEDSASPDKPEQSGAEQTKKTEVAENANKLVGEQNKVANVLVQPNLHHQATDGKAREEITS